MAKKKLQSLHQTHGELQKFQPTSLDQILGDSGQDKFGTMNEKEYVDKLDAMIKVRGDIQAEAVKHNLVPIDDPIRLKDSLLRQFRLHVGAYRVPAKVATQRQEISPEVAKILAQGK